VLHKLFHQIKPSEEQIFYSLFTNLDLTLKRFSKSYLYTEQCIHSTEAKCFWNFLWAFNYCIEIRENICSIMIA